MINKRFGKWVVKEKLSERRNGSVLWLCQCDCGKECKVTTSALKRSRSKSCTSCCQVKDVCIRGHKLADWGRTSSGSCRGCVKHKSLYRCYGITLEEYEAIWKSQDGKCAICGKPIALFPKGTPGWQEALRTETDHDHSKKFKDDKKASVRGLLCGGRWAGCNRKLGKIDKIGWLESVVKYLKNPPAQQVLKKNSKRE